MEQAIWVPDYERKSNYGWLALNNDKLFSFVSYQAHCNTDMKIVLLYPPPQKKKKKKMCNEYDNFVFDRNINPKNFVDCKYDIGQIKNLSTCNKKYISPFST